MWNLDVPEILIALGIAACVVWAIYNRVNWREGIRK